jgi:hypothetical protein
MKQASDQMERVLAERNRLEAESPNDPDLAEALPKLFRQYEHRKGNEPYEATAAWYEKQLNGKTLEQVVEAWDSK